MYQTILKKFSEDGIHLNDEQDNFLIIFEKNLPRKSFITNFFKKKIKKRLLRPWRCWKGKNYDAKCNI